MGPKEHTIIDMPPTTQPTPPVTTMPRQSKIPLIVGLGIVVLLIIASFVYAPFGAFLKNFWTGLSSPAVVKESTYIGGKDGMRVLYTVGMFGIDTRSFDAQSVVDYAQSGDMKVAILESADGKMDVYDVSSNQPVALTTDGKDKMSLAISPDKLSVAYGVKERSIPVKNPDPAYTVYNILDWDVVMLTVADKTTLVLGPGNHPRFYEGGVFYPAPMGFVWRTPGSDGFDPRDVGSLSKDDTVFRMIELPVFESNGLFAYPSTIAPQYNQLRIAKTNPLQIESAGDPIKLPAGTRDLVIGTDGMPYTLTELVGGDIGIVRLDATGGTHVLYRFPTGYAPDQFTHAQ